MRSILALQPGMADLGADDVTSLKAQLAIINSQINDQINERTKAYAGWNYNHFGGQTQDQFNAIIGRINSQIDALTAQAAAISQKIAEAQNATANAEAATANKQALDIQIKQASPEEQINTAARMAFLSSIVRGVPDYGMKSNSRNKFFAKDSGLSGLGLDLMDAVIKGVQKSAPTAFKDVKLSQGMVSPGAFNIPGFSGLKIPDPLKKIATGLGTVGKAVISEAKNQKPKVVASQVDAAPTQFSGGSPASNPMNNPWVLGGAAAVLTLIALKMKKGKRK